MTWRDVTASLQWRSRAIQLVAKSGLFRIRKACACKVEGDNPAAGRDLGRCLEIDSPTFGEGRFEPYRSWCRITERSRFASVMAIPRFREIQNAAKVVIGHRAVTIDSLSPEKAVFLAIALHVYIGERIGHEMFPIHSQHVIRGADPERSTRVLGDTVDRLTQRIGQLARYLHVTEIAKGQSVRGGDPQHVFRIFKDRCSHLREISDPPWSLSNDRFEMHRVRPVWLSTCFHHLLR